MALNLLKGVEFPADKLEMKMSKSGDFLYHEGPLLSHWVNEKDEHYLMAWCDQDEIYNRWMVYKTTVTLLRKFFEEGYTLRDLILNNPDGFVFFVDIDNNIDWKRAFKVKTDCIGEGYLPGNASFFEDNGFEPYAYQLKSDFAIQFSKPEKKYKPIAELETSLAMEPPVHYRTEKKSDL